MGRPLLLKQFFIKLLLSTREGIGFHCKVIICKMSTVTTLVAFSFDPYFLHDQSILSSIRILRLCGKHTYSDDTRNFDFGFAVLLSKRIEYVREK